MKILFFARLRELNGAPSVELSEVSAPQTVAELRHILRQTVTEQLAEALGDANVFCAVNQQVVDDSFCVSPGDEIAFFPPMTGG